MWNYHDNTIKVTKVVNKQLYILNVHLLCLCSSDCRILALLSALFYTANT